jgi:hypothetical protein
MSQKRKTLREERQKETGLHPAGKLFWRVGELESLEQVLKIMQWRLP